MSRGVLIFAFDNEALSYTDIADWNAHRIQKHLGLPTVVVTDTDKKLKHADTIQVNTSTGSGSRWFDDLESSVVWKNKNRFDAYSLSPFDETLLLDADYVVNSAVLAGCFGSAQSILPMGRAYDVTGLTDYSHLNAFGELAWPMSWATAVYFRKCAIADHVFSIMNTIQDNWKYYCYLYKVNKSNYRNDFSLSIAMNTAFGNRARWPVLPFEMASVDPIHHLSQVDETTFDVRYLDHDKRLKRVQLHNVDFHAMGKKWLGEIVANSS